MQAVIRDATPDDAKALILMGAAFFEEAGMPERGVTFDPNGFIGFCGALAEQGVLLVAEDAERGICGMMGAGIVPAFWNPATLLAQECFWFVAPEARKKGRIGAQLLDELEARAGKKGAKLLSMVSEHGLRGDAVGRLYRAKGYAPAETTYFKGLAA